MSAEEIRRLIYIGIEIAKDNVFADITYIEPNTPYASYEFDDDRITNIVDDAVEIELLT